MKCIVILGLLFLAFCNFAYAAPRDVILKNYSSFLHRASQASTLGITGGQEATPGQFPYQVGLFLKYKLYEGFCGGSLISTRSVLTAASCAEGAISIELVFGAQNISDKTELTQQRQTSSNYVIHPNWDIYSITNDLAIIKLSHSVKLNKFVQIVELANGSNTYAGVEGTITGRGLTYNSQRGVTDILRYASNNVLSNNQCKSTDSIYNAIIQRFHLCLSGNGNKGICLGDNGGPMVSNGVQIGVASFSFETCDAGKPSVFVRLTEYTQWIKDNL